MDEDEELRNMDVNALVLLQKLAELLDKEECREVVSLVLLVLKGRDDKIKKLEAELKRRGMN